MLKILISQAGKLFSSKKNGGRYVYKSTDRLHDYKQVVLLMSIALLLGYSQFRPHFECGQHANLDKKTMTNFCWINGTKTITNLNGSDSSATHVGMNYKREDPNLKVINHNYMRSLWLLLILMAGCSYLAQRNWSSIFKHDTLIALLKLPEHDKLPIVSTASKIHPYETLTKFSSINPEDVLKDGNSKPRYTYPKVKIDDPNQKQDQPQQVQPQQPQPQPQQPPQSLAEEYQDLLLSIEMMCGDSNAHQRTLDYYVNQLICLLITKRASAYRLTELSLRRKLLKHHLYSSMLTITQYFLPMTFIGDHYKYYGWNYFKLWLRYTLTKIGGNQTLDDVNSIDYEMSSSIWPTLAMCEFEQVGQRHADRITVQCSIPINEICGKLFVVIWWLVVFNVMVELYLLVAMLVCSANIRILRWAFGRRFWPKARQQARDLATFRFRRTGNSLKPAKCLEKRPRNALKSFKRMSFKDDEGFKEVEENMNVYYLLYLLYLRLGCSKRKTQQVIRATSHALNAHLDYMREMELSMTQKVSHIFLNGK